VRSLLSTASPQATHFHAAADSKEEPGRERKALAILPRDSLQTWESSLGWDHPGTIYGMRIQLPLKDDGYRR